MECGTAVIRAADWNFNQCWIPYLNALKLQHNISALRAVQYIFLTDFCGDREVHSLHSWLKFRFFPVKCPPKSPLMIEDETVTWTSLNCNPLITLIIRKQPAQDESTQPPTKHHLTISFASPAFPDAYENHQGFSIAVSPLIQNGSPMKRNPEKL